MRKTIAIAALAVLPVIPVGVLSMPAPPASADTASTLESVLAVGTSLLQTAEQYGITPTSVAKFAWGQASGPVTKYVLTAIGLGSLAASPDSAQLAAIQKQLDVVIGKLDAISGQVQDVKNELLKANLKKDSDELDHWDHVATNILTQDFTPLVNTKATLVKVQAKAEADPPQATKDDVTEAQNAVADARKKFNDAYDRNETVIDDIHAKLIPGSSDSVLAEYGKVLLAQKRYLTTADSVAIRNVYLQYESTEALMSWMHLERNVPTATGADLRAQQEATVKGYTDKFIKDTAQEFSYLPPMIPPDVVIDTGTGTTTKATTTNNAIMYLPASQKTLPYYPGHPDPGTVDDALAAVNAQYSAGFNDWHVPTRAEFTRLLGGYDELKKPATTTTTGSTTTSSVPVPKTTDEFLSSLNPASAAWKAIQSRSWNQVWASDLQKVNYCSYGFGSDRGATFYLAVTTSTNTPTWGAHPGEAVKPHLTTAEACDQYLIALHTSPQYYPDAYGGLLVARSTGTMPVDYMGTYLPGSAKPTIAAGAVLRRTDLTGFNLTNLDLSNADLRGTNLTTATVTGANLTGANLAGAATGDTLGTPASLPAGWQLFGGVDGADGALVGPGANLANANLTHANLSRVQLTGVSSGKTDCRYCDLPVGWRWTGLHSGYLVGPGANLSGANLAGVDLSDLDLSGANLTNADLTDADLSSTRLIGANVTGATLTGATVTRLRSSGLVGTPKMPADWRVQNGYLAAPGVNLVGDNLSGADLSNANLSGADMVLANLTNTNLTNATLSGVQMTQATITGANFSTNDDNKFAGIVSEHLIGIPKAMSSTNRFRIVGGFFVGPNTNLASSYFDPKAQLGGSLSGTNFTGANLSGLNLTGATLTYTILTNATLTGTNLSGTTMSDAQLTGVKSGGTTGNPLLPPGWKLVNGYLVGPGASLQGANLSGANLTGVNLSGADLTGATLTFVTWSNTTCPNGKVQSDPCPVAFGANGPSSVKVAVDAAQNSFHVNVDPDLGGTANWTFNVEQLQPSGGWKVVATGQSRGGTETATVNQPKGTYRVVVPAQKDYLSSTSDSVVLSQ